ncbi:MAG: hypothetical protein AAGI30_05085 [Planctomycetota bacterium]
MSELISWLLGSPALDASDPSVGVGFARPIEAWAWAVIAMIALGVSVWSYSRLVGSRPVRATLAGVRTLTIVWLVLLLAGPQLLQRQESVERDWVLALVDRSASLGIRDELAAGERVTRDRALRGALDEQAVALESIAADRELVWLGFDASAYPLESERGEATPELDAPEGRVTALGRALDGALSRAAARPLAGVVVFTDGRSVDEPTRAALRRLRDDRIPVYAVPLGGQARAVDLALGGADWPRASALGDVVPVRARVERRTAGDEPISARVRLVDVDTGEELESRAIDLAGDEVATEVTLAHQPADAGDRRWRVEVVSSGGPDLAPDNDQIDVAIRVVDEPIRVLYLDGYPRWEQRYLRNLLLREGTIVSSALMLAPEREFQQEGNIELSTLPVSPEEWAEFDVVVIGDMTPSVLGEQQIAALAEHVSTRGGGLLWIAGPRHTPARWDGTSLEPLLPVASGEPESWREAITLRPTPLAERAGVLRVADISAESAALAEGVAPGWPDELADPFVGWSRLRQAHRPALSHLKPAAEPLALATGVDSGETAPVILTMRYGAGRVTYVATDEIWRYRYGRGEIWYERFWLQLIRQLARPGLAAAGRPAVVEVSPARGVVGEPVRIELRVTDAALGEDQGAERLVRLRPVTEDGAGPSTEITLRAETEGAARFSAVWAGNRVGSYIVEAIDPDLIGLGVESSFQLTEPAGELARPEPDHALLESLVAQSVGGRVLGLDQLQELEHLPNRSRRLVDERVEPLWDTPLALLGVLVLLVVEWVGRRVIRLV